MRDAFISHASKDAAFAREVAAALTHEALSVWIDDQDVAFGGLLRDDLAAAIRDSRVLVLLWSRSAFGSRWVMAELLVAFHVGRFVVPCVLDDTPLPQFLANLAYIDRARDQVSVATKLCRAIRGAPDAANRTTPPLVGQPPKEVQELIEMIAHAQVKALLTMSGDREGAAALHGALATAVARAREIAPFDAMVLNLAGYQAKNDYTLAHWDAIQAGRAPTDEALARAERLFFESLSVNPNDPSALNGLGSILFYERELDAAEFFVQTALDLTGGVYEAAKYDLDMMRRFKRPS